ncbi:MAG: recombinase family protein, partial [Acidobacteria bacterium]|nr:recombinase family protein [Acidobacteriota bacterium]
RKENNVSHLIVTDLSRLARKVDVQVGFLAQLDALGIKFVSLDEPLTDNSANGNFMRNITGCVNQLFSDTLSERTRQRMRAAVLEGRYLWPAPIGYVNRNKNIEPDPVRGPLVRQAFDLVASGRFVTTERVLNFLTSMGLTTKKGRPVPPQTFSRMLSNETYAGWIITGDLRVRGTYEPIVSDETFAAVQMKLNKKGIAHKKLNEDFPLRGIVRCGKCERPLTAGWAKGRTERYARYWCWTKDCGQNGISRDELHKQFVGLLSLIEPTVELLAQLPDRIANQWSERKNRIAADAKRLSSKLADIKALNQKALTEKLQGKIEDEDYDDFKKANAEEAFRINSEINALDSERNTMEEMLKQAQEEAVDLVGAWEKGAFTSVRNSRSHSFPMG